MQHIGLRVIEQEMAGLQALKPLMDARFDAVVEMLSALSGRVIVTGMGKSGHIARKIAATLASTGTPALFIHPAEASHGDLGMIAQGDAVIALSNSGETQELVDIIAYCKRLSIPLVGIARKPESMLLEAADYAVLLPDAPEASSINAPTTSTTLSLVYGDALAVALQEKAGFTHADFGVFHPGGKLGKAFMRVSDVMHGAEELPLVMRTLSMDEVLIEMTRKRFGCVGVTDDAGALIGIITDGDLRRHMNSELLESTAEEVMTRAPQSVAPNQLAAEALDIMEVRKITSVFVCENDAPVGILHIHDLLRAGVA